MINWFDINCDILLYVSYDILLDIVNKIIMTD